MYPKQSLITQPWRRLLILCLVLSRPILAQKTNLWDWITYMIGHCFSAGSLTAVSCSCTLLSSPQVHSFTFALCSPSNIPPPPILFQVGHIFCLVVMFSSDFFFLFFFNLPRIKFDKSKGREGGESGPIMVREKSKLKRGVRDGDRGETVKMLKQTDRRERSS